MMESTKYIIATDWRDSVRLIRKLEQHGYNRRPPDPVTFTKRLLIITAIRKYSIARKKDTFDYVATRQLNKYIGVKIDFERKMCDLITRDQIKYLSR